MTKKIDKVNRQQALLHSLNSNTYNRIEFMATHHITDRTIRRDLNELAERGEIFQDRLNILRKVCLGKLTKKANDGSLADHLMVQLVVSGEPKKIEQKTEYTEKVLHVVVSAKLMKDEPTTARVKPELRST